MPNLILVMLGGAIGAAFRYQVGRIAAERLGHSFPWGTFTVNLVGSLLMGLLASVLAQAGRASEPLLLFTGVGVLGGFTTFSAFSLETARMIERGDFATAAIYSVSSVLAGVAMLFVGLWVGRAAA
ncbi:MAG: fluoride efflux transporter CrcB [Pseudomonadota bacterium]|nr:fluoride efflux transporter CrcB [Pseudomonadota bacterium]